jgi:uncharacterized protein
MSTHRDAPEADELRDVAIRNHDAGKAEPENPQDEPHSGQPNEAFAVRSIGPPTTLSDYARAELAVFYLGLFVLTEVVAVHVDPAWGSAGFAALVVGLMVGALQAVQSGNLNVAGLSLTERRDSNLRVALLLPPLIGIASLTLPLQRLGELGRPGAVALPALVAAFAAMRANGYRRHDIGLSLPQSWLNASLNLIVAASGIGLGYVWFRMSESNSSPPEPVSIAGVSVAILLAVSAGFTNEFVYRGILQRAASDLFGPLIGVVYVAALSTAPVIVQPSLLDTAFFFLVAVAFGAAVQRTRSIFGVSIAHAIALLCAFVVFPAIAGSG